jgi:LPXTG-motif cell wall-anchored protein
MKKILAFLVVLGILSGAYATVDDSFSTSIFYKGDVILSLDKESYNAGDELTGTITAANMEDFSIVNSAIVVEVVKGDKEHYYPSQESDNDSVIYEKVIDVLTLAPKSQKKVTFSYKIPADAKSGDYRVDVYLGNERTPVVGMPAIFVAPKSVSFTVTGTGAFPAAAISRTKTVFMGQAGPLGLTVAPSGKVTGDVVIQSSSPTVLADLKLKVIVCSWDDTMCSGSSILFAKEYEIQTLEASKTTNVPVEFTAPTAPDAYAIRLELLDASGRTLSLYRSRIVTAGETGRVRKLAVDKLNYKKGESGTVSVLVSASPDGSETTVSKNVKLTVSLAQGGSTAYSSSSTIPELSIANGATVNEFAFTADRDLSGFTVCSKLESESGKLFDQYCYTIDAEKAKTGINEVSAETSFAANTLTATLCARDTSGAASSVVSTIMLYSSDSTSQIENKGSAKLEPCTSVSFNVEAGDYLLLVNDMATNKQYRFPVNARVDAKVCGNSKCEGTENSGNCCKDCGCASGLVCTDNACVATTPTTEDTTTSIESTTTTIPGTGGNNSNILILGVVVILIILAIVYFTKKK